MQIYETPTVEVPISLLQSLSKEGQQAKELWDSVKNDITPVQWFLSYAHTYTNSSFIPLSEDLRLYRILTTSNISELTAEAIYLQVAGYENEAGPLDRNQDWQEMIEYLANEIR